MQIFMIIIPLVCWPHWSRRTSIKYLSIQTIVLGNMNCFDDLLSSNCITSVIFKGVTLAKFQFLTAIGKCALEKKLCKLTVDHSSLPINMWYFPSHKITFLKYQVIANIKSIYETYCIDLHLFLVLLLILNGTATY